LSTTPELLSPQIDTALEKEEIVSLHATHNILQCSEYYDDINLPYVGINNEKAAYEVVGHLANCGCKNILLFSADNKSVTTTKRIEGYIRGLKDANIEFNPSNIINGNYGYNSSYNLLDKKLQQGLTFDGIFAISDKMAAGCIKALKNNKISIPNEVKVVGFDNVDISYMSSPEITTISQPQYNIGRTAIKMLIDKMQGKEIEKSVILEHKLIIRNSTLKGE
jgi:alanine racemase